MTSVESVLLDLSSGKAGITLVSKMVGQCAAVDTVDGGNHTAKIQPGDILFFIATKSDTCRRCAFSCVKTSSMDSVLAETHLHDLRDSLCQVEESGQPFQLHLRRLHSTLSVQSDTECLVTLSVPSALVCDMVLELKLPTLEGTWSARGSISASVRRPTVAAVGGVDFDSKSQTIVIELSLQNRGQDDLTKAIMCIEGLLWTPRRASDELLVPPVEFGGFIEATTFVIGEKVRMSYSFYDHLHMLLDDMQASVKEATEIVCPGDYTTKVFKRFSSDEFITFEETNELIRSYGRPDLTELQREDWVRICYIHHAKADVGLTCSQFASCWDEIDAKQHILRLEMVESAFHLLLQTYDVEIVGAPVKEQTLSIKLLPHAMRLLGVPQDQAVQVLDDLRERRVHAWDFHSFSHAICGTHSIIRFPNHGAMGTIVATKTQLQTALKIFDRYRSLDDVMRKADYERLLMDTNSVKTTLTLDQWAVICEVEGQRDLTDVFLSKADFVAVYVTGKQGALNAFATWVPLKELSVDGDAVDTTTQNSTYLDTDIAVAPERVDVNYIADKVLREMLTTDDAMKDMVREGLEFTESDVTDVLNKEFSFETAFKARHSSRTGGSLHIEIKSIAELADHIVKTNDSVATGDVCATDDEKLFVVLELTDKMGLAKYFVKTRDDSASYWLRVRRFLFGKDRGIEKPTEAPGDALEQIELSIDPRDVVPGEVDGGSQTEVTAKKLQHRQVRSSQVSTKEVMNSVLQFPENKFELALPVTVEAESDALEYVVCRLFKCAASATPKFVGQASFKLDALLNVLDANDKVTEDLRVLQSEEQADVGVLVVRFRYTCTQAVASEQKLPPIPVKVECDDGSNPDGAATSEDGFAYPADTPLIVSWEVQGDLVRGDRIYLVREGMPSKFTHPFFLTVWLSTSGKHSESERCEWWVPKSCALSYSVTREVAGNAVPDALDMVRMRCVSSDKGGDIVFPSSMGLGLPPGTYRLYLLRYASDSSSKCRMILGRSAPLAVIPDINGMHTCFGSTPLIDVRQLCANVQLFLDESDQAYDLPGPASSGANASRDRGDDTRDELRIKLELGAAKRCKANAEKGLDTHHKEQWVERLEGVIQDLESKLADVNLGQTPRMQLKDGIDPTSTDGDPTVVNPSASSTRLLTSGCHVSIHFQLDGGTPSPGDHIVILPAEVVHAADLLRASILGKLQTNDSVELDSVRSSLEMELSDVCWQMWIYQLRYWIFLFRGKELVYALVYILMAWFKGVGAVFAVDSLRHGSTKGWVKNECQQQYERASSVAKTYFPYIVRELLSEVEARRRALGLPEPSEGFEQGSIDTTDDIISGCRHQLLDIAIPPVVVKLAVTSVGNNCEEKDTLNAVPPRSPRSPRSPHRVTRAASLRISNHPVTLSGAGVLSAKLKNQVFWEGGEYIVKYVRRLAANGELSSTLTAGELGRFGPFFVNPHPIDFESNPTVAIKSWWKRFRDIGTSQVARLIYRLGILAFLSLIKYALVVLSLSFNIEMVALNLGLSIKEVQKLVEAFQGRLNAAMLSLFVWFRFDLLAEGLRKVWERLQFGFFIKHFECVTGFLLYVFLGMLFGAMLLMYIVIRADLLLKVQQWHTVLGVRLGKTAQGFSEQIGTLLVILVYLTIKSVVLYIAQSLYEFTVRTNGKKSSQTLADLRLFTNATDACPNVHFARFNTFVGFVALMLIIIFIFICVPIVVLDLFTWAPLPPPRKIKLEQAKALRRKQVANRTTREKIQAAIAREETLVEWDAINTGVRSLWRTTKDASRKLTRSVVLPRFAIMRLPDHPLSDKLKAIMRSLSVKVHRCFCHPMFGNYDDIYDDFYHFSHEELADKYGFIGGLWVVRRVYQHLMLQSIKRGLGDLAGLRPSHKDMYASRRVQPRSKQRWKQFDRPCLWFNFWWKYEFFKSHVFTPLRNVIAVTIGYWGVQQWATFQVEARANEGFPMEPSGESRQLQLMGLQGKIVSLFWLCFPRMSILSFLAELLNTGPVAGYFVNTKFLQADTLDTERQEDPVWRIHRWFGPKDETDVTYLIGSTQFSGTFIKWVSAFVQVVTLSVAYMFRKREDGALASVYQVLLVAAGVPTTLEFNQAALAAYLDYVERVESSLKNLEEPTSDDASGKLAIVQTKGRKESGDDSFKMKKELVRLNAMPVLSYVVLADALGEGEGEITISWQVNASQRYDALDAIGMFPARAPGDKEWTMDDCVCYQLLNETSAKKIGSMNKTPLGGESPEIDTGDSRVALQSLRPLIKENSQSREIQAMVSKTDDALSGDAENPSTGQEVTRSRAISQASVKAEERRRTRRVVSGQVKFRPVNSSVDESDETFERFKHGNSDGIYQAKYGLQAYEFCYLRYDKESQRLAQDASMRKIETEKKARNADKPDHTVTPVGVIDEGSTVADASVPLLNASGYEVTQFTSNTIRIGTFNLHMNLTCAHSLVRTNGRLDLSWSINGIPYSILSNPKSRNCVGFFKVGGDGSTVDESDQCARVEILPPSAYLEPKDDQPCHGRATVTTPSEPGVYEVRFLVNYFKDAQLHRLCQDFGALEDEMQELRIRSVHEKRLLADALGAFKLRAAGVWGDTAHHTRAWFGSMLLSSLWELEIASEDVVKKLTAAQARELLVVSLEKNLQAALDTPSELDQVVFARLVAPLQLRAFTDVVIAAFDSSSQLEDQLAAVTFASPTDEDKQMRKEMKGKESDESAAGFHERYSIFVPQSDRPLIEYGAVAFVPLANSYLQTPSLCGFFDFMDDILLNQEQLMQNYKHVVTRLADSCVDLYKESVAQAIDEAIEKFPKLAPTIRGARPAATLACLNLIQSIVSAFLLTDIHTGRRWPGPFKDAMKKMNNLRTSRLTKTAPVEKYQINVLVDGNGHSRDVGRVPFTPGYLALREWAHRRLVEKIVDLLKVRHSRRAGSNIHVAQQAWRKMKFWEDVSNTLKLPKARPFPKLKFSTDTCKLDFDRFIEVKAASSPEETSATSEQLQ